MYFSKLIFLIENNSFIYYNLIIPWGNIEKKIEIFLWKELETLFLSVKI